MKPAWLLLSLLGVGVAPAYAEPALVDQVERLDVEGGELEFEWQSIFADETDEEERTAIHILSGEYGVSDRVSLGFELGAEDEDGEPLVGEYLLLQAKFVALDPRTSAFGFGAQASIGPSLRGESGEAELEILGETSVGDFEIAADIALEAELDDMSEAAARYALRADWPQAWGVIALEAGGDLEPTEEDARRHWLGPVAGFDIADRARVEMSYLRGLNDDTPEDQVRLQITLVASD